MPPKSVLLAWLILLAILPMVAVADEWGWDLVPMRNALHSLHAGKDVYASDIAAQDAFRSQSAHAPGAEPPLMYVYPPITLPLLHALGAVRMPYKAALFLVVCVLGYILQTWAGSRALQPREARSFAYLAPLALFFPGLLANSNVLSGNIAYVLYGVMLLAAVRGWRGEQNEQRWGLFYAAVLLASAFKTPYLTLLAVPVFCSRREWGRAGLTALAGVALFLAQALLWPTLFAHYLRALAVMFEWQHDFGSSPAGMLATALIGRGHASSSSFLGFYLVYAVPLFAWLFYLSRRYLAGAFSLEQWIPTLLVGVILLNPRIIEYDVAPLTVPLALIGWRALQGLRLPLRPVVGGTGFLAVNAFALVSWKNWKLAEGAVLVLFFGVGSVMLLRSGAAARAPMDSEDDGDALPLTR
jgi:hypothetical protein